MLLTRGVARMHAVRQHLRLARAVTCQTVAVLAVAAIGCSPGVREDVAASATTDPLTTSVALPRVSLADDPPAGLAGTVVFQSDRDGRSKLFALDLATRVVTAVTTGADHHDVDPAWSPDGTQLAFASTRFDHSTYDLGVVGLDGSGVRRLTAHGAFERHPSWAPDGRSVFFSSQQDGTQAVFRVGLETGQVTRVSVGPNRALHPNAAPDGRRLAYTVGTEEGLQVVLHELSTGAIRRVGGGADGQAWPAWSRDGEHLALTRLRPDGSYLEIVNLRTDAVAPLAVADIAELREPAWSPDGRYLVASATTRSGDLADWDLVLLRVAPPIAAFRLTRGAANDTRPAWAPR